MIKILFVCNNMEFGGVQKSLINLLKYVCNTYDVSLMLFSDSGYYMSKIPTKVKRLKTNNFLRLLGSTQKQTKELSFFLYFLRGFLVAFSKVFNNVLPRKLIFSTVDNIEGYNVAISFTQNNSDKSLALGCNEFVLNKVKCKYKISFVHCDFKNYGGNTKRSREIYANFDRIACVSCGNKESFVSENPLLKSKTFVVRNCHDYKEIIQKSQQGTKTYEKSNFNIVTVARLSEEKGILRALYAIKNVIDKGYSIKWHIVGDGNQKHEIRTLIKKLDLNDSVVLYGSDSNPYKYILNADLFMLPSLHEAAPIVFNEALALGVPVLTTETTSAKEMIGDNQVGFVCANSQEGIEIELINIISGLDNLKRKKLQILNNYNNDIAITQFQKLITE